MRFYIFTSLIFLLTIGVDPQQTFISYDSDMLKYPNFNPIISVDIVRVNDATVYCYARSVFPIKYQIKIWHRDGGYKLTPDKFVYFYKVASYVMLCEASVSFGDQTWTRLVTASWLLRYKEEEDQLVRLSDGKARGEGNIMFKYDGKWRYICDDNFGRDVGGQRNGDIVCAELGFAGLLEMASDGRFGQENDEFYMDDVKCKGHELSLVECPSVKGRDAGDSSRKADNPASLVCSLDPLMRRLYYEKSFRPIMKITKDKFNTTVSVSCSHLTILHQQHIVQMQRIRGGSNGIPEFVKLSPEYVNVLITNKEALIQFNYTFKVDPLHDFSDMFICSVDDFTMINSENITVNHEFPIERVKLEYDNVTNSVLCVPNAANPPSTFHWTVGGKSLPDTHSSISLENIDAWKRICCEATQVIEKKTVKVSNCRRIAKMERATFHNTTLCMSKMDTIKCSQNYTMELDRVLIGKLDSCINPQIENCDSQEMKHFINHERCYDGQCNLHIDILTRSYGVIMLSKLPAYCNSGNVNVLHVHYYCIPKDDL